VRTNKIAKVVLWIAVVTGTATALLILGSSFFVYSHGVDQAAVCRLNLEYLDMATSQWAFENKKPDGTLITTNDIMPYLKYGMPKCPIGGQYILTKVGEMPRCSIPTNEHKIVY